MSGWTFTMAPIPFRIAAWSSITSTPPNSSSVRNHAAGYRRHTVSKNVSKGVGTVLVLVGAVLACVVKKSEQNWRGFEA